MRSSAIVAFALLAVAAGAAVREKPHRNGAPTGTPSWITKELKPIVNKPVVTR